MRRRRGENTKIKGVREESEGRREEEKRKEEGD